MDMNNRKDSSSPSVTGARVVNIRSPCSDAESEILEVPVLHAARPIRFFTQESDIYSTATSRFPSLDEFGGEHDFQLGIGYPEKEAHTYDVKQKYWHYSTLLKKVFVAEGQAVPFQFKLTSNGPRPADLYVRAMLVYTQPGSLHLPVLRCPGHRTNRSDPLNKDYRHVEHVLSSTKRSYAVYETNPTTGRRSVCVRLLGPQAGCEWELLMFSMMCRSSCPVDGIDRRALAIVFTLEQYCKVLGRRTMQIRASGFPSRAVKLEERRMFPESFNLASPSTEPFHVPVTHVDDFVPLARKARDWVLSHFPEGPLKVQELQRYDNLLRACQHNQQ